MAFLHLTERIPKKVCLALSGGLDSMVGLDFCVKNRIDVTALHFNHGNSASGSYEFFVSEYCKSRNIKLITGKIDSKVPCGRSKEDFWREKRYDFFESNRSSLPVVTCHHLDDAVETWIFSSLKGNPKVIPHKRDCFLRPFLLNTRQSMESWAIENNIPFIQDKSNFDNSFDRNFIRNELMSGVLRINPGIHKVVKKKILKKLNKL